MRLTAPEYLALIEKELARRKASKEPWEAFAAKTQIRSGKRMMPFVPYEYQKRMINLIEGHYGTVVGKTRQLGFSESIVSYFLWRAYDDPGFLGVVFSKTQDDTSNLAKRVRLMAGSHPDVVLAANSTKDIVLQNGGRIVFRPSTDNAARGLESVSAILFDECAFVDGIENIYGAALPSTDMLGDDARIIILSTPNGRQGFYWQRLNEHNGEYDVLKVCEQMRSGELPPVFHWIDEEGWVKFFVHWKAHPIYGKQAKYLEQTKKKKRITDGQLQREYNLGFDDQGANVFPPKLLAECANGGWLTPQYGRAYVAGIDPAFGSNDFFNLQIWDITTQPYDLVAEYRANLKTKDYNLSQSIALIDQYNPSFLVCEVNGGGALILEELIKLRPHLSVAGCNTTNASKLLHTDRLTLLLERRALSFPPDSGFAIDAPHFTEYNNGRTRTRQAESGFHDDGVMCAAVAFSALEAATEGRWLDGLVD